MDDLLKSLLFDAVIHRKPILFDAQKGEFTLGLSRFPANAKIQISQIGHQVRDNPYTLFQIYYFLLHYDKPVDRYMMKAKEDNVRFVAYLHREKIFGELFPGVQPSKFNPAWLLESQLTDAAPEEEEPERKKPRRVVTEEERERWAEYLRSYEGAVTGATEISRHWHAANEGPPKLPAEHKQLIAADALSAERLEQLQKPVVTRGEAMRVAPGARGETVKFFEDVLAIMTTVRQKERQGIGGKAKPAGGTPVSTSTPGGPKRAWERDVANPKGTPMHAMPLRLNPKGEHRRKVMPIIIVPNVPSALITLVNASDFLENGQWVEPCAKKIQLAQAGSCLSRPESVLIDASKLVSPSELATLRAKFTQFRVTDNPLKLRSSEWDYVCGCFVLGAQWQFRNWFSESPVEIFSRVCGFHLTFLDDRPHPLSSKWSVTQLQVGRQDHQRHIDRKVAKEFWHCLYRHMRQCETFQALP